MPKPDLHIPEAKKKKEPEYDWRLRGQRVKEAWLTVAVFLIQASSSRLQVQ